MISSNDNSSVAAFMEALTTLVRTAREQNLGPDAVLQILAEQGNGGEEHIKVLVERIFNEFEKIEANK